MERAKVIWEELGLPKLKPEAPWFGYSLGEWPAHMDEAARRAVRGEYLETGAQLEKRRRKDVRMNTEVRNVEVRKPKASKRRRS
jgi:4-hydroxy-3-polyprenylbenzoate decarboxylase